VLKLKCDELLSKFAFNCNVRRYTKAWKDDEAAALKTAKEWTQQFAMKGA
jgi:hypothetical protein